MRIGFVLAALGASTLLGCLVAGIVSGSTHIKDLAAYTALGGALMLGTGVSVFFWVDGDDREGV
mgnify:CR=1 FL=1